MSTNTTLDVAATSTPPADLGTAARAHTPGTAAEAAGSAGAPLVHRAVSLIANLALGLAVLGLVGVALLPVFGHRALVVTSDSMEPLLSAGDVAILQDVAVNDLRPGDVVTYQGYGSDRLATHRVVEVTELDTGPHLRTRSDADGAPAADLAPAAGVVGRYITRVPGIGRVVQLLDSRQGLLLLVGVPALVLVVGEAHLATASRSDGTTMRRRRS